MRLTLKTLAPLVLAYPLLAGSLVLQLGNPSASPEAVKAGAVLTVKAAGCHDPAAATLTATAVGTVNGQRREIPLKVTPLSEPGMFAISQQWPREGKWVIDLVARNEQQFTNTLVTAGPDGVDRGSAKTNLKQFTPADVEAMLK
jgi:hypothetical protein